MTGVLPIVGRLVVTVAGRPAPQGSKQLGESGQLREQSVYLPAWRMAVKKAVYRRYSALGVEAAALPLLRGPVGVRIAFRLSADRRADAPPDLDKLLRATWDALTAARVWEDDGRVVHEESSKVRAGPGQPTGADIEIWSVDID